MKKKLSTKQENILDYIQEFLDEHQFPPTVRDIQSGCGISSTSVVDYNLRILQREGHLKREAEVSRGIELLGEYAVGHSDGLVNIPVLGSIAAGEPLSIPPSSSWHEEALENVELPLLISGVKSTEGRQRALDSLEMVGLKDWATHRPSELSGGERLRVAVLRALINHPALVLADEPTGNLDSETADSVFKLMLQLNQTLQTSFVIVTHNRSLTSQMSRSLLLQDGKLFDNATKDLDL
mgnify:CR=1 FL=1